MSQQQSGKLEAIWIKRAKAGPMDPASRATLEEGRGLVGNANQGGKRQVTIIEQERWQAVTGGLNVELDPSTRRANLMVSGITLQETRGRVLQIGDCRIRIYGETRPCELMDQFQPGLRRALQPNWGGGAFGEVLDSGEISVGNSVQWLE
ncbi:MAG: MOSC domain-containing protein, partial [Chloroflexi bacterium]